MFYAFCRFMVKIFFHIKYKIRVINKERVPKQKGGIIIASNHVSNSDPPMVGIVFHGKCTFMAKEELFKNKLFGWLIRHLGAFPIKRGARDESGFDKAIEGLSGGNNFVIFPEGTRSKTGELGKPKSGVSVIAVRAKVPVYPVFIKYGKKKFRQNVIISIGEPISGDKFDIDLEDRREIHRISNMIMGEIIKLKENSPDIK